VLPPQLQLLVVPRVGHDARWLLAHGEVDACGAAAKGLRALVDPPLGGFCRDRPRVFVEHLGAAELGQDGVQVPSRRWVHRLVRVSLGGGLGLDYSLVGALRSQVDWPLRRLVRRSRSPDIGDGHGLRQHTQGEGGSVAI